MLVSGVLCVLASPCYIYPSCYSQYVRVNELAKPAIKSLPNNIKSVTTSPPSPALLALRYPPKTSLIMTLDISCVLSLFMHQSP